MNNTDALLVLNAVRGLGNRGIRKLLDRYGSASHILSLHEPDLLANPIVSPKVIRNILNFPGDKFLETEYNLMAKRGVKVVSWMDHDYPELLCETPDAPVVLYVKGKLPSQDSLFMAIVGSRKASFYGQSISEKFAVRLAELGFTVVSGMARGIDTAAHKGTLKAGGKTVAVLGCGLSNIYPLENMDLMEEISGEGAVISEFPMKTLPLAHNFPRRNRIISGLSLGVIVVEAAQRSGALITADFALEQGREVFAVPGKIDQPSSGGVNNLIKQGAKLVMCVEDILEDIEPHVLAYLESRKECSLEPRVSCISEDKSRLSCEKDDEERLNKLSNEERLVLDHITDRPVHIDELTNCCEATVPVMSVLLQLELKHLIKQLPGKQFITLWKSEKIRECEKSL